MEVVSINTRTTLSNRLYGGKWLFPLDLLIGKRLTKNTIVSVEASAPLIPGYNLYESRLQTRLSFTF